MSRCAVCDTRIYGSGNYCTLHKPKYRPSHTQEYYNYSSNSAYPGETHFRTSAGTAGAVARRHHHHSDHRDSHNQLALYSQPHNQPYNQSYNQSYNQPYNGTQVVNLPLAQTLTQAFTHLQDTYVIASVTYDGQEITVNANLEREQCLVCHVWFPNHDKLVWHQIENPVGCEVHGVCMRKEDALWHGTARQHERCFVRGCRSAFRAEGGWRDSTVERHVRDHHYG